MASIDLPAHLPPAILEPPPDAPPDSTWPEDPLHAWLLREPKIEVPVYAWPHTPTPDVPRRRLLRIAFPPPQNRRSDAGSEASLAAPHASRVTRTDDDAGPAQAEIERDSGDNPLLCGGTHSLC